MHTAIRFAGSCPTCGRHLHIPIELYGKRVRCHGCNAEFRANSQRESVSFREAGSVGHGQDSRVCHLSETIPALPQSALDLRIDSLIAAADRQLHQAR